MLRSILVVLTLPALALPIGPTQSRTIVEQERQEFAEWLRSSRVSPLRAVAVRTIEAGLSLGPAYADVPLPGVPAARLTQEGGRVRLLAGSQSRAVPRGKPAPLGQWQLVVSGPAGHATLSVFAPARVKEKYPEWFPYDTGLRKTVRLEPRAAVGAEPVRLLAPDGAEAEASEAGTVTVQIGGTRSTLRVFRIAGATEEESELEVYFRDATSGKGTYPAGRFVALIPAGAAGYLLDFNRARNPFCAYNTVYPCPAPWRGNALAEPVRAGERYREQ